MYKRHLDLLRDELDFDINSNAEIVDIFEILKKLILEGDNWLSISKIFSSIILHIVSDIVTENERFNDDIKIFKLLSDLLLSFPSIQPLIHYYNSINPISESSNITNNTFIISVFRLITNMNSVLDVKLSKFYEIIPNVFNNKESLYYVYCIIAILQKESEEELQSKLDQDIPIEIQFKLFKREKEFCDFRVLFENLGPINFSSRYATTVGGIPFLKSISFNDDFSEPSVVSSPFARSLALGMMANKPVMILGPHGSGKSTTVEQLARLAGTSLIPLHLGSSIDSKSLLGGYVCSDIPGEFKWLDGPLTSAVRENEKWIVFEQIEEASDEVLSIIHPLLSERKLFIPGRNETVRLGYNTRIFATSSTDFELSLWTRIKIDFLQLDNLKILIQNLDHQFPFVDNLINSWLVCQNLTYHELFRAYRRLIKLCRVNNITTNHISDNICINMFQIVVDTFTSHIPDQNKRIEIAKFITSYWCLSESAAEQYLRDSKPQLVINSEVFQIGFCTLPVYDTELNGIREPYFAETFTSLHNMESIARALSMNEAVLLIGETGTGKTTLIQYIASSVKADLIVINMHHQSDTLDIIGGFKPVYLDKLFHNFHQRFCNLFAETVDCASQKNAQLRYNICELFKNKSWEIYLGKIYKTAQKILDNLKEDKAHLISEWTWIHDVSVKYLKKKDFLIRGFAFDFVEGPLTTAYRDGKWVLLDEVNLAPAETLLALSTFIDGNDFSLPNGNVISRHPNFRLVCCMNPPTDVGKTNLPDTLVHKFVSIFSDETQTEADIKLILEKRGIDNKFRDPIYKFYTKARELSKTVLTDGSGRRVIYSLRALTRSLVYINSAKQYFKDYRSVVVDGLRLSFVSPLSDESASILLAQLDLLKKELNITKNNSDNDISFSIVNESTHNNDDFIIVENFPIRKGPEPISKDDKSFILTKTAQKHLKLLSQAAFLEKTPTLLQGPTSAGKTSLVEYLAKKTGNKFVRINNHEHTDISEYIGSYSTTESGGFEFVEGQLVRAVREGAWVVLDELNLAPSDVLEALNRLLDQNSQLYIAETNTIVEPGKGFHLFATQNPPGLYGGRKQLSRAFRGRFIEIHVDEIDASELQTILEQRFDLNKSFASTMVNVFKDIKSNKTQFNQIFSGKHGFLTVRDLIKWAKRQPDDWEQLAKQGFEVLGSRLRVKSERELLKQIIKKNCRIQVSLDEKYDVDPSLVMPGIVLTSTMKRCFNLIKRCIENNEPVLLVGETGTGKTLACQVIANYFQRNLVILNCHKHTETSDFIGAMRPSQTESDKLFEWVDGSLVNAMKEGNIFLMDEISLAQDSVLERLNSVLEPSRMLSITEKPQGEVIKAVDNFAFVATMNPGGDHGKRELSPSLRNRFTEIWVPSTESPEDLLNILETKAKNETTKSHQHMFLNFFFKFRSISSHISLRDILQWLSFVDLCIVKYSSPEMFTDYFVHGAFMIFIDSVPISHKRDCVNILNDLLNENNLAFSEGQVDINKGFSVNIQFSETHLSVGKFNIQTYGQPKYINFSYNAPTTSQNLFKVIRALQLNLPVLLEGPPGIGKTSLVSSLSYSIGQQVVRINLSEHTEMIDLIGSELPDENESNGSFSWRDGAFLTALKEGHWVILDELNLASQSVLEGLNACLDHRAALFVPELNKEFKCHPNFRIFGCQNPVSGGGGRKSLPKSFLNRFAKVYLDELTTNDFKNIISSCFMTEISVELRDKVVDFVSRVNSLKLDFEFNLRDIFRWCEMKKAGIDYMRSLQLLFILRIRSDSVKNKIQEIAEEIFGPIHTNPSSIHIAPTSVYLGNLSFKKKCFCIPHDLKIHPYILKPLEAVLTCYKMNWCGLIVGSAATAKSSLVRLAAHITGNTLVEFSMNNSIDTTELLGGFEQIDNHRFYQQLKDRIKNYHKSAEYLRVIESINTEEELSSFILSNKDLFKETNIVEQAARLDNRNNEQGKFEWVDGMLLQAMQNGWWIILDNANLCSPAVLDRLNSLCEPNGFITLNERGLVNNQILDIYPHDDFRLFLTIDPKFGEISRAMRNRAIEIYLPSYSERRSDVDGLLLKECIALSGSYGNEFYSVLQSLSDSESLYLSAWNMNSLKSFRELTNLAQLGEDGSFFNIARCQIVTDITEDERNSNLTRSNSFEVQCSINNDINSIISFRPFTNTIISQVFYDAMYIIMKGPHPAAIRYFIGNIHKYDYEYRRCFSYDYSIVNNILDSIINSQLINFDYNISDKQNIIMEFNNDLPIDPLLHPNAEDTFAFTCLYLISTLQLDSSNIGDINSVTLKMNLSSLIPSAYESIINYIKNLILNRSNINVSLLTVIRSIDYLNRLNSNSLAVLRFICSLFTKESNDEIYVNKLFQHICPVESKVSKKSRKVLGEPFTFKTKYSFHIWNEVNNYWRSLYENHPKYFYRISKDVIRILKNLIISQEKTIDIGNELKNIIEKEIPKEIEISFLDEDEDLNIPSTVSIKTVVPFPSEKLQQISMYSIFHYTINCVINNDQILLPKIYEVLLDHIALIETYNQTKNMTDLMFVMMELVHHMNSSPFSGLASRSVDIVLCDNPNLIQIGHSKELKDSLFCLLYRIPAYTSHNIHEPFIEFLNIEVKKLDLHTIDKDNFNNSIADYAIKRWDKISALSEVDDSHYNSVISKISNELIEILKDEKEVLSEITYSNYGERDSPIVISYNKELEYLQNIYRKSIKRSKYRGDIDQYSKLKSIVAVVNETMHSEPNSELIKAINDSASSLLNDFMLYRDIVIPLVTTMRMASFSMSSTNICSTPVIPLPITVNTYYRAISPLVESEMYYKPMFFALLGHCGNILLPRIHYDLPPSQSNFVTIDENAKREQELKELFTPRRKDELYILAKTFIDSMIRPQTLSIDTLFDFVYMQSKMHNNGMSIDADLNYLPIYLYKASVLNNKKKVDMYQNDSATDLDELFSIVLSVIESTSKLWSKYPGHDQLRIIAKKAGFILQRPVKTPLNEFLELLEQLINEIKTWSNAAIDYGSILSKMVRLANKWLKMRLKSWMYLFENRKKFIENEIGVRFYNLLQAFYDDTENFVSHSKTILENAPLCYLDTYSELINSFGLYSTRVFDSDRLQNILFDLTNKYLSTIPYIEDYFRENLREVEEKMRNLTQLYKWDTDSLKKHILNIDDAKRQLNQYCQKKMKVIGPVFQVMKDQLIDTIARSTKVEYRKDSVVDDYIQTVFKSELPLSEKADKTRQFAQSQYGCSGYQMRRRDIVNDSPINPLFNHVFNEHNQIYGEIQLMYDSIQTMLTFTSNEDSIKIRTEDSVMLYNMCQELLVYARRQRMELKSVPIQYTENVMFIMKQVEAILKSFVSIDISDEKTAISKITNEISSLLQLKEVPIKDVQEKLHAISNILSDNYVHSSIKAFISNSLDILSDIPHNSFPKLTYNKKLADKHLSDLCFILAAFRIVWISFKDGFEQPDNDKQEEAAGKDGIGMGEGVGDEDVTNEIEDQDQLVGDNVNTNQDKQDENDVDRDGGFEIENEMPEDAPDVSAHEEEEEMNNEMGETKDEENVKEREAEDPTKNTEKIGDVNEQSVENRQQQDGEDEEEAEEVELPEPQDDPELSGEISMDENEDQFESDAGEWDENNKEDIDMPDNEENLLENIESDENIVVDENEEEENAEFTPDNVETVPDKFIGMIAQDRSNMEEEDNNENQEVDGTGKGEKKGEGMKGEGNENELNEEEEESKDNKEIDGETTDNTPIVKKNLINGSTQDGDEGAERDENGEESIILQSEKHQDIQDKEDDNDDRISNDKISKQENEPTIDSDELENTKTQEKISMNFAFTETEIARNNNKSTINTLDVQFSENDKLTWLEMVNASFTLSAELCEQLRLILESTVASKMKGDFRTGKRLNMRKIIPFIASGFKKDKIWMRRIQPDQRNYQIMIAIDNSESMDKGGQLAIESVCMITQALTLLGVGDLCVTKFGETADLVHPLGKQWSEDAGASLINIFDFKEKSTSVLDLLSNLVSYFESQKKVGSMQLAFIISDGIFGDKERVKEFVIQAQMVNILIIFVIIDNQQKDKCSILQLKNYHDGKIINYMDDFPFPFYILIEDPNSLPKMLSDALRQWFDLAHSGN